VISRLKQMLFTLMLLACVVMAAFLIRLRERAFDRMQAPIANAAPLSEAPDAPQESVTLMMPNDADGSLAPLQRSLALPQDPSTRARVLLEQLIASWHDPASTHPIDIASGIDSVFLLPIAGHPGEQLAVVNFNAAFPAAQPSGIEPETLTLLSIIQTLHANLPAITQVRFLVDGQARDTLAGHADLTRTYLAEPAPATTATATPSQSPS
jgi:Sporulation and spore germination